MSEKKHKLEDIVGATADFGKVGLSHVRMVQSDVKLKHRNMAKAAFPFFRATFIAGPSGGRSFAPNWPGRPQFSPSGICTWKILARGATLKAASSGESMISTRPGPRPTRWTWFAWLPVAIWPSRKMHLSSPVRGLPCIEQGYRDSLAKGGAPFVLAEHHRWLRLVALNKLRDPVLFWKKIRSCPRYKGKLPRTF